mgnify:CR=1 FL=1
MRHYPSLAAALIALYPGEPWEASKFVASALEEESKRNNVDKQRALVNHIGQQLNVKEVRPQNSQCELTLDSLPYSV